MTEDKLTTYRILISYEEKGIVTVKAGSLQQAELDVEDSMEQDGLDKLDFDCKYREYYTHGEAR